MELRKSVILTQRLIAFIWRTKKMEKSNPQMGEVILKAMDEAHSGAVRRARGSNEKYIYLMPNNSGHLLEWYFMTKNQFSTPDGESRKRAEILLDALEPGIKKHFQMSRGYSIKGIPVVESEHVEKITCVSTSSGVCFSTLSMKDVCDICNEPEKTEEEGQE
jgi:hypothetical protein